ncbi:MAG TPA: hypothetical protein ENJ05_06740 [Thiotrichales bacterium]|nr:hypothetical protein [Thiotrichales bacterium]
MALTLLAITGLLALTALGLLIWALYGWLAATLSQPQAAALTALAVLVATGGMAWLAMRVNR